MKEFGQEIASIGSDMNSLGYFGSKNCSPHNSGVVTFLALVCSQWSTVGHK
ncbi:hypothetical protein LguiA_001973 [Lonicera macranthoides]